MLFHFSIAVNNSVSSKRFFGGLCFSVDEHSPCEYVCGQIENVGLNFLGPMSIVMKEGDGKFQCFGFVNFENAEAVVLTVEGVVRCVSQILESAFTSPFQLLSLNKLPAGNFSGIYGMRWRDLHEVDIQIKDVFSILFVDCIVLLPFAYYLNQVASLGSGIRTHPINVLQYFGKIGKMDEALQLFDELPAKNVVSWNAMILGHCIHGCPTDGLTLFAEMVGHGSSTKTGAKTTSKEKGMTAEVTFMGLLGACVRPGLMLEGQKYFLEMLPKYHISPKFAPFWGMANRYASLGLIQEVDFCRFLGHVEVVDRLDNHLIELERTNTFHSPLLWSVSRVAGRWEDVFKVKEIVEASNETPKQDEASHVTAAPTSYAACVNILSTKCFTKWRVAAYPWGPILEPLIIGNATSIQTLEWRVEELRKDKLQSWALSTIQDWDGVTDSSLSKKDQGMIQMVVALVAAGAHAGAVTDPTSQNWSKVQLLVMLVWFPSLLLLEIRHTIHNSELKAQQQPATNVLGGLTLGYKSAIIPIFAIAVAICLAAIYGFCVAVLGMLSTITTGLVLDTYGLKGEEAHVACVVDLLGHGGYPAAATKVMEDYTGRTGCWPSILSTVFTAAYKPVMHIPSILDQFTVVGLLAASANLGALHKGKHLLAYINRDPLFTVLFRSQGSH